MVVEGLLLAQGQGELDGRGVLECMVESQELFAQGVKVFVQGLSGAFVKDVVPFGFLVQVVEEEAAEQAVLYVGHEVDHLLRGAGEYGGKAGLFHLDVFPLAAAEVGDGFVVKGFAEAVGEVAEVLAEGGGEGIAFGLEHQALLVVLIEGLVDGGGAAVGREEEEADGRRCGLRDAVGFLLTLVGFFLQPELFFLLGAEVPEFVVNGLYEASAEAESAFATAGTSGDEEIEVGINDHLGVDAGDVGEAGR